MKPVAVYSPTYGDYALGKGHPFHPGRYALTLELCAQLGCDVASVAPPPVDDELLARVHTPEYIAAVAAACRDLQPRPGYGLGTADNPLAPQLDKGARAIVGGTVHAARLLQEGRARRVWQVGGGLHHALPDRASGFCIYNDLAVAITRLVDHGWRVAYLDIDVHHGDGVQHVFYESAAVMTISLHESGRFLFPGTGEITELGEGEGRGFSLNVPLSPATDDAAYLTAFELVVPRALAWFRPDVLVVQAGADAHRDDPLADLRLTTHGYARLFARIVELAEEHAAGRLLVTLGGGYDPWASVRVWTILCLTLWDHPLHREKHVPLPRQWLKTWERFRSRLKGVPSLLSWRSHRPPPAVLHDPAVSEVDETERRHAGEIALRLLAAAEPHWR